MEWRRVPGRLSALEVALPGSRDAAFGRCCYPLKLAESLACGIPVVAADIGDARILVSGETACLYRPGDIKGLAEAVALQLAAPRHPAPLQVHDWDQRAAALAGLLTLASPSDRTTY